MFRKGIRERIKEISKKNKNLRLYKS